MNSEINPYQGTLHGGKPDPAEPQPRKWGPNLLGCLGIIVILGLFAALFLPMPRTAGESARRVQCASNLKQIGIALHTYHDKYGALPPAYTVDTNGKRLHSWRTLILPFMEQQHLYDKIDLTKPWDDPANKAAFDDGVAAYACPSTPGPLTQTIYLAVTLPGGCFQRGEPRKFSEITDGPANTIMVLEVPEAQAVHWMSPTDSIDLSFMDPKSKARLQHSGGTQAVFADGTVRYLSTRLDPKTLRALMTIDAKDNVGDY